MVKERARERWRVDCVRECERERGRGGMRVACMQPGREREKQRERERERDNERERERVCRSTNTDANGTVSKVQILTQRSCEEGPLRVVRVSAVCAIHGPLRAVCATHELKAAIAA